MNDSDLARFESYVDRSGGPNACHLWMGCVVKGYGIFGIKDPRKTGRKAWTTKLAHRCAFLLAHGRWPEPFGCHSCDVRYATDDKTYRRCCNPAHIFEGTAADNQTWMVAQKRSGFGERNSIAKLTEARVRALLALRGTMTQQRAADLFGICRAHVGDIWNGRRWAHL